MSLAVFAMSCQKTPPWGWEAPRIDSRPIPAHVVVAFGSLSTQFNYNEIQSTASNFGASASRVYSFQCDNGVYSLNITIKSNVLQDSSYSINSTNGSVTIMQDQGSLVLGLLESDSVQVDLKAGSYGAISGVFNGALNSPFDGMHELSGTLTNVPNPN